MPENCTITPDSDSHNSTNTCLWDWLHSVRIFAISPDESTFALHAAGHGIEFADALADTFHEHIRPEFRELCRWLSADPPKIPEPLTVSGTIRAFKPMLPLLASLVESESFNQ
jgi:hypothetical protein